MRMSRTCRLLLEALFFFSGSVNPWAWIASLLGLFPQAQVKSLSTALLMRLQRIFKGATDASSAVIVVFRCWLDYCYLSYYL